MNAHTRLKLLVLFGVLAVPLTYILGRRLLGTMVGLVGALLVAISPHLVWYSQEAKMYSAVLALGLLAIYALRRALEPISLRTSTDARAASKRAISSRAASLIGQRGQLPPRSSRVSSTLVIHPSTSSVVARTRSNVSTSRITNETVPTTVLFAGR